MAESLITELKRRNIFKVITAYLVLFWVVVQVTSEAVPALHLPDWVNSLVFFLGAIGFPFVILFAWAFELTPEGIKRAVEVDKSESITHETGKKLNALIISLLVIGLFYFIYESRFQERTESLPVAETPIKDTSGTAEQRSETVADSTSEEIIQSPTINGVSIAVMPFDNMTGDSNKEFFSDGISEEILNVLAQIPNLHVTSRSSAFAFKDKKINLSDVAEKLGVENVLEGSVRMDGNQVRITAQLIEAKTDKHLWSATYDRELNSIFAIQDEISKAIVEALKDKLNIAGNVKVATSTVVDLAAHQAYLKGRYFMEKRTKDDLDIALREFDKAIQIEPGYAQAWVGKARTLLYLSESNYGDLPVEIVFDRASILLDKAEQLDPNNAELYAVRGSVISEVKSSEQAYQYYDRALELNPNLVVAYSWYGNDVSIAKDPDKRFELRKKAYQLDPVSLLTVVNYAYSLADYGRFEEAITLGKQQSAMYPENHIPILILFNAYMQSFRNGEAAYYGKKLIARSEATGDRWWASIAFNNLGLNEEAENALKNTTLDYLRYFYQGNQEQVLALVRQTYPRSESDRFGNFLRGLAENGIGNYKDAVKYLQDASFCEPCLDVFWGLKAIDDPRFEQRLSTRKQQQKFGTESGLTGRWWQLMQLDLYLLDDDIQSAVRHLTGLINDGYIIEQPLKLGAPYKPLREHPSWDLLMTLSEQNRVEQRQIYEDLVAAEQRDRADRESGS